MKMIPKISETEWRVMQVLWNQHPLSSNHIIEALASREGDWHPKTVRTLLTRLVEKGALSFKEDGRSYLYSPLVTEQDCIQAASESFLERVFGGSLKPLLVHFVEQQRLTPEEVRELRELLDKTARSEEARVAKKGKKS